MNMNIEKKEYVAPKMEVVELINETNLLCGSNPENCYGDDPSIEDDYID